MRHGSAADRSISERSADKAGALDQRVIGWYRLFLPCDFLEWNEFDLLPLDGKHHAVSLFCQGPDAVGPKPCGQCTVGRRWRSPALQVTQDRQARFLPCQGFKLFGKLDGVTDVCLVEFGELL